MSYDIEKGNKIAYRTIGICNLNVSKITEVSADHPILKMERRECIEANKNINNYWI